MSKLTERGYVLRASGPVYYTLDMDKTALWFESVLGWFASIGERDKNGNGMFGVVCDLPDEISQLDITPFTGIHLFNGPPREGLIAFMRVQNLDALHAYVLKSGWTQITDIRRELSGRRICSVKTIDGCTLRFFEG